MSSSNFDSLQGKYTCKGTTSNATCSTLYYIDVFNQNSVRPSLALTSSVEYTQGNGSYTSPYIVDTN